MAVATAPGTQFVSVTDLSSFLYCPKALYQQRILGRGQQLSEAMILGSIRHKFHDLATANEERIVVHMPAQLSRQEVTNTYMEVYSNLLRMAAHNYMKPLAIFGRDVNDVCAQLSAVVAAEAAERAANVHFFSESHNVFGEQLWEQLSPKIFTEVKVKSLGLRLKGTVDRVEMHSTHILPIELKTGKMAREGVWPSHRVQVAAYMMLLQEQFGRPIERAIVRYLDHGSNRTVVLNPYMELEVKELTEKVFRLFAGGKMPPPCQRESCQCREEA